MDKKVLVEVSGGLGKHIIFTALVPELKKKYKEIHVTSSYFDIMKACPEVKKSHPFGQVDLSEMVYEKDCDVIAGNPYTNQRFIKKKIHLLEAWSELLGIPYVKSKIYKPIIKPERLGPQYIEDAEKAIKQIGGKFILVQFYGGQSPMNGGQGNYVEILKRNFYKCKVLVKELKKKYPKYKIVNFSLANEPPIPDTIKLEIPYLLYFQLAKEAEQIICIDSSLQHIAAAVGKQAYVIWGETRPEHFGWSIHKNIVIDDQQGSPYFVALGPSPVYIDFPRVSEIMEQLE